MKAGERSRISAQRRWYVGVVTRPDAGGTLYAPVRIVNNKEVEHGVEPSYDREAVARFVRDLNKEVQS